MARAEAALFRSVADRLLAAFDAWEDADDQPNGRSKADLKLIDAAAAERQRFLRISPDGMSEADAAYERLRRTLEARSVVLMGPNSPFWRCQYCQAMQTTPIAFQHKADCLLAKAQP